MTRNMLTCMHSSVRIRYTFSVERVNNISLVNNISEYPTILKKIKIETSSGTKFFLRKQRETIHSQNADTSSFFLVSRGFFFFAKCRHLRRRKITINRMIPSWIPDIIRDFEASQLISCKQSILSAKRLLLDKLRQCN